MGPLLEPARSICGSRYSAAGRDDCAMAEWVRFILNEGLELDCAPKTISAQNQGYVFQRTAARARRVLAAYGSSELGESQCRIGRTNFSKCRHAFKFRQSAQWARTSLIIVQKDRG